MLLRAADLPPGFAAGLTGARPVALVIAVPEQPSTETSVDLTIARKAPVTTTTTTPPPATTNHAALVGVLAVIGFLAAAAITVSVVRIRHRRFARRVEAHVDRYRDAVHRTLRPTQYSRDTTMLRDGLVELDLTNHEAVVGLRRVHLDDAEYAVLGLLMRHPNVPVSRRDVARVAAAATGRHGEPPPGLASAVVTTLRNKLEVDGEDRVVTTVPGVGYVFGRPTKTAERERVKHRLLGSRSGSH